MLKCNVNFGYGDCKDVVTMYRLAFYKHIIPVSPSYFHFYRYCEKHAFIEVRSASNIYSPNQMICSIHSILEIPELLPVDVLELLS